jgi:outer membrane lipoprotein-sorting protein
MKAFSSLGQKLKSNREKRFAVFLFVAILSFLSVITATAQTADSIIQKHIAAIGGADNWRKIYSIKKICTRNSRGVEQPIIITILRDKGYKVEYTMNGMTGYTIITDKAGWRYSPFQGQQQVDKIPDESIKQSQDLLDIEGPLIDYKIKSNKITCLGTDDVEGTECHKLKVIFPSGKEETIFIDASDYSLVRTIFKTNANGKEQVQTTNYGDYQKLPEGIIYPMSVDGGGSLTIKSIEINKPIDESIFRPAESRTENKK